MDILYRGHFGRAIGTNGDSVSDEQLNDFLKEIVSTKFRGFSLMHLDGYWNGQADKSFVLEIITSEDNAPFITAIASAYCSLFSQDAVLFYSTPVSGMQFVTKAA